MPGRVSARASGASPRKSSTQTLKTRASSTRASAAAPTAIDVPDEGPDTALRAELCRALAKAQHGTAVQRKVASDLRKVHEACCYEGVKPVTLAAQWADYGEGEFNDEFARCVLRILPVKKSEPVGDRVVRFVGVFLKFASEKDNAIAQPEDAEATDIFPETPASRLTSHVLSLLLPLLNVKDKTVRFRCTQIIAHIINTLDSIDNDLFPHVRLGLLKRLRDKEASVRVQAVLGLGRLADAEGEDEDISDSDDEAAGARGVLQKLIDTLQHDPSAEVRRSLLMNLPFAPSTLPYLLERARDLDAATRRALYSRLLPALGDFRHLSLTHREKLLRWGLRDRDENVRKATARLFRERWIEDCTGSQDAEEDGAAEQQQRLPQQASKPSIDALLELLERIDIVNSGVETGIAHEAMREFWDGRPDYRECLSFEDPFWHELTAESAFVARTFNHFCRRSDDTRLLELVEDKMPEVTKFAFLLQQNLNTLIQGVQRVALQEQEGGDDAEDVEEDTVQQEFCVEQLLHIALTLDYSDEVGRRQMFTVMREALALAELPEECTRLCIEVLRTVCGANAAGEREFCGIVLEAVAEVHDTIMGDDADESFHSARSAVSGDSTPTKGKRGGKTKRDDSDVEDEDQEKEVDEDKAVREIMVNMKCLHIAQCMLQNVQCELEQNSVLVTMLNNLVVPAVRSQEAPIRERGLTCLGLCCLLSKNLAAENLTLFLHCFAKGHDALQTIALQIITDILTTHPSLLSSSPPTAQETANSSPAKSTPTGNSLLKPLQKTYLRSLKSPDASVQTTGAVSLSKLLLARVLPPDPASLVAEPLKQLACAYFDPDTAANPALRQALAYFLPVYGHSRAANAERLATVAAAVVHALVAMREELCDGDDVVDDEGAGGMVSLAVVGAALVDWTDPRRLVIVGGGLAPGEGDGEAAEPTGMAHLILAEEVLERLLTAGCTKEEKKTYISMLSKLHIPAALPSTSPDSIVGDPASTVRTISDLIAEALDGRLAAEASARNTLTKLSTAIAKLLATIAPTTTGDLATDTAIDVDARRGSDASDATATATGNGVARTGRDSAGAASVSDPASDDPTIIDDRRESAQSVDEISLLTSRLQMTGAPEAEGTVFAGEDEDDGEDEEAETTLGPEDESIVDSLLESEV